MMQKVSLVGKIKSTIKLALPIVIGQLGVMLMGLADTIQVGQMKSQVAESLGASGMAGSIFFTIAIIGLICLQIISPMISKSVAENNDAECGNLMRAGIRVTLILSLLTILIIAIIGWNYDLFQQSSINKKLTLPYLVLIAISVIPTFLFAAFKSFSDGLKRTSIAMNITILALVLNVIGNHICINGLGPIPAMGLFGAGISTLLCRIFMAISLGLYIFKSPSFTKYFAHMGSEHHTWVLEKTILKVGIPAGFQGFFEIATFGMAVVMMGWISSTAQAAHIVAINMASLTYMMATGIAAAGGIHVGTDIGEKNRAGIFISGNAALLLSIIFMGICAIIMFTCKPWLVRGYTQEADVIAIAVSLVTWGAIFQLFDGIQAVSLGLLRGLQDVKIPTAITVVSYWGVGIPLSYYLGIYGDLGAVGIWIGLTCSLICSAALLSWRFYARTQVIDFNSLQVED
ncbi:MATE family efflux transporter [Aquirufa aurantiipilula]|uniref:Multidrug-efflux transporter n=1 Tax=Aquirufa aurantiipilula TaxID=2696561 RepID=A0ABT6BMC7_9BACT|nr:MATE family efflux transporter [Aquirufa aurantiipilula]MDF5691637.1 MATE family efflux transporter [Aquirufa aurantiipilula]